MLNLVLDLEQNRNDQAFCSGSENEHRKIHYVLDENVFEMFIQPRKMKAAASTFYSPFWLKVSTDHSAWSDFAAQSALVTSEYLLSGELPGQDGKRIYMTEWHRGELSRRIIDIFKELRQEFQAAETRGETTELETTLKELLAIRSEPNELDRAAAFRKFIARNPLLQQDLDQIDADSGAPRLQRFAVARILAEMFSNDRYLEPMEQIRRLDKDIYGRIYNITSRFSPQDIPRGTIENWAKTWHEALQAELDYARRPEDDRSPTALWNDARSLALVTWAAGQCDPQKDRVVFVTGDIIVFNAYRRWFLEAHIRAPGKPGPFALRHLVQYAPILNLTGEFSDISGASKLMEATRQAMEVSLLPFNLSSMGSSPQNDRKSSRFVTPRDPEVLRRGREYLTLKYVNRKAVDEDASLTRFTSKLTEDWFRERMTELRRICELWKQNERIAIGSMYRLLEPRLSERVRLVVKALELNSKAQVSDLLAERAKFLMSQILDSHVDFWLPAAAEFVNEELNASLGERGKLSLRAPICPTIVLHRGEKEYDLGELIETRLDGGNSEVKRVLSFRDRADAETEPELAFAVASALALGLRDWSNADLYADLAVRAATMEGHSKRSPPSQPFELRYLHAIAKRFRVGEIGKPALERTADVLGRRFNDAKIILDQCLEFHNGRFERNEEHEPPEILPLMRTLSERAALHGFYAASIGLADKTTWKRGSEIAALGTSAIFNAAKDLVACWKLSAHVGEMATDIGRRKKFILRLKRQFISNFAALRVVNKLFYNDATLPADFPSDVQIAAMIDDLGLPDAALPPLVRAEVIAFFVVMGRDVAANAKELDALKDSVSEIAILPLDRDLLPRICEVGV